MKIYGNPKALDGPVIKVKDFNETLENIRRELKDPSLDCWGIDKIIDKYTLGVENE